MIPAIVFVSVGWMALLCSIGAVARLDKGTQIISAFTGAILWAVWGASALEIGMTTGAPQPQAVEVVSLNYLGYVFAALLIGVGIYQAITAVREQETGSDSLFS